MYSLHLSPEQLEFRDTVREFVEHEVKPVTLKAERLDAADRSLPIDVLRKASQIGLRTLALPEDLGGVGADALTFCIVTEELAAGEAGVAAVLSETSALGRRLFGAMTPEQRERFGPAFLVDDDYHLACAERELGENLALGVNYRRPPAPQRAIATTATRSGRDFVITGVKVGVANAPIAKLFAIEAVTDRGAALILVPAGTPGLAVSEPDEPHWHHGACGLVELRDCRVPADNLLGISDTLVHGRTAPISQALNLGIGRAAYEAALEYAQLRVQGGRPIIDHQAIGTKLADIAIRLEIARSAVWRAAWAFDHAEAYADRSLPDLPIATIAQVVTSEAIHKVTKDAAECFGAMGVMRDMPLQKYIRDALICLHAGEGNADARLRIAEALVNYRRPDRPLLAAE
jgi:alkylation response protein AidB-like acyl-CoA dehydrogenase